MTAIPDTSNSESTQKKLDDAVQLLQLAASLHAARGDSDAWRAALGACRDWFQCDGLLGLLADGNDFGSDELDALAGRVTHCANFGCGTCAELQADVVKRSRCAALAPHLHEAAILSRKALQASVFDYLPPTWILARTGKVREANAAAKAMTDAHQAFKHVDGHLVPVSPGGAKLLCSALADISAKTQLTWIDPHVGEVRLTLRPLAGNLGVAAELSLELPKFAEIAALLCDQFGLHPRQSELAAHLVEGHSLSHSARLMGITRNTAHEHLVALIRRTGAADRKALVARFRRAVLR